MISDQRTESRRTGSLKPTVRRLSLALFAADALLIVGVFNVVASLRGVRLPGDPLLLVELLPPLALLLFALYLIDGHSPRTDLVSVDYASQHMIAVSLAAIGTLLLTFVIIPQNDASRDVLRSSRGVILISFIALAPLTLGLRRGIRLHYQRLHGQRSIVFVGTRLQCQSFREDYARNGMQLPLILAEVSDQTASPFPDSSGNHRDLPALLDQIQRGALAVEAIVLRESGRDLEPLATERLLALYFAGVPTFTLEFFHEVYWRKIPLYRLNRTWLFQEGFQIARDPAFARLKRLSDIVLSSLGLILASPLILAAAAAIWCEDRGPVFFRQDRTGRNGLPFPLLKLRTMRVRAEAGDPYTRPGDSRITRVGGFLRASRIDEFPQLWNVLRGHMSLIGPRAEWVRLVQDYEAKIPCYHYRHLVKPGITGWAQVNYPYGANLEDTQRKLEFDLYYIRHFSFLMDAAIVMKTIHVMLFGKGR